MLHDTPMLTVQSMHAAVRLSFSIIWLPGPHLQIESDGGSISEGMTPSVGGGGGGSSARHLSSDSEMSILVVPLNLCGEGVKFDAGSMRNLMVGKDNSVKSFFESCSWGKLSVPEDNVKIVDVRMFVGCDSAAGICLLLCHLHAVVHAAVSACLLPAEMGAPCMHG